MCVCEGGKRPASFRASFPPPPGLPMKICTVDTGWTNTVLYCKVTNECSTAVQCNKLLVVLELYKCNYSIN